MKNNLITAFLYLIIMHASAMQSPISNYLHYLPRELWHELYDYCDTVKQVNQWHLVAQDFRRALPWMKMTYATMRIIEKGKAKSARLFDKHFDIWVKSHAENCQNDDELQNQRAPTNQPVTCFLQYLPEDLWNHIYHYLFYAKLCKQVDNWYLLDVEFNGHKHRGLYEAMKRGLAHTKDKNCCHEENNPLLICWIRELEGQISDKFISKISTQKKI